MIAVDTSVVISFMKGDDIPQAEQFRALLEEGRAVFPPSVVTELLSSRDQSEEVETLIFGMTVMPLTDGYWERAGRARALVRGTGAKAALGDALIAQACIDAAIPLLTNDGDFQVYARMAGLALA